MRGAGARALPAAPRDREAVRREKVVVDSPEKRIDVFLSPYWGFAIERLIEAIRSGRHRGRGARGAALRAGPRDAAQRATSTSGRPSR